MSKPRILEFAVGEEEKGARLADVTASAAGVWIAVYGWDNQVDFRWEQWDELTQKVAAYRAAEQPPTADRETQDER